MKRRILALTMTLSLLLTSCGITRPGGATATTMHLKRTEGQVGVSDGAGKDVEPREDLGLYSGYGVDTRSESYAWIDLDEVKLTKLDEDSQIAITKEDKKLEIEVLSGSLFFNVTQPLAEDETMTIRSATMAVGIRGTCGWVSLSEDEETLSVCLLEGKVECTAGKETAMVRAGETALLSIADGEGSIDVHAFREEDIPAFVLSELSDEFLDEAREILAHGPTQKDLAALGTVAYYGDPASCAMTPAQAAAFAQVIRDEAVRMEQMRLERSQFMPGLLNRSSQCYASLFDTGSGIPALFFGGGAIYRVTGDEYLWTGAGDSGLWTYTQADGAVRTSEYTGHTVALYDGYLFCGGIVGGTSPGLPIRYRVYPLTPNGIAPEPASTASYEGETQDTYLVDGRTADREQFETWQAGWTDGQDSLTGHRSGGGVEGYFWGMSPIEDVLAVLDAWGSDSGSSPDTPAPSGGSLEQLRNSLSQNPVHYGDTLVIQVSGSAPSFLNPEDVLGFINGVMADVNGDGEEELITVTAVSDNSTQADIYGQDGSRLGSASGSYYRSGEYGGGNSTLEVILFRSQEMNCWCVAFANHIQSALNEFDASVYTVSASGSLEYYDRWYWDDISDADGTNLEVLKNNLTAIGWPYLETGFLSIRNENADCIWLSRAEVVPDGADRYLRITSPDALTRLP